jgi:3-methyladenine DNA glycosylase/8-oxoguanine DNA glycosylase
VDAERRIDVPRGYDFFGSLRFLPNGGLSAACRVGADEAWRAARTPAGPVTLRLARGDGVVLATAWGTGADWALERARALLGLEDDPGAFRPEPPRLRALARRARGSHLPKSPWVFDALAGVILQQRVAFRDALRSHRRLIERLGEEAPGPAGLLLPLSPRHWLALSGEDLRRSGVDGQRARALRAAARASRQLEMTFAMGRAAAREALASIPGLGPWSVEMTMGWALGDPDAVPTGDLHLPSLVSWALAHEPYADDARMLALLEPYRGQRFRLIRLLLAAGFSRPGAPG